MSNLFARTQPSSRNYGVAFCRYYGRSGFCFCKIKYGRDNAAMNPRSYSTAHSDDSGYGY